MSYVISCPYNPPWLQRRETAPGSVITTTATAGGHQTACSADTQVRLTSINGRLNMWIDRLYLDYRQ